jgi:hypothetical protein
MSKREWIIAFLFTQIVGGVSSFFANVHLHPFALLFTVIFLFPGTAVFELWGDLGESFGAKCLALTMAVLVNVAAWCAVAGLIRMIRRAHRT